MFHFDLGMISTKEGVRSIKVDLKQKEGTVEYLENVVTAEEIAEQISDMGFDAVVTSVNGKQVKKGIS